MYTIYRTNALWCATIRTDGRAPVDRTMLQRTKELASNMCLSMTLPRSGAHKPSASMFVSCNYLQLSLTHSDWVYGKGRHMLTIAIQYGKCREFVTAGSFRVITQDQPRARTGGTAASGTTLSIDPRAEGPLWSVAIRPRNVILLRTLRRKDE